MSAVPYVRQVKVIKEVEFGDRGNMRRAWILESGKSTSIRTGTERHPNVDPYPIQHHLVRRIRKIRALEFFIFSKKQAPVE